MEDVDGRATAVTLGRTGRTERRAALVVEGGDEVAVVCVGGVEEGVSVDGRVSDVCQAGAQTEVGRVGGEAEEDAAVERRCWVELRDGVRAVDGLLRAPSAACAVCEEAEHRVWAGSGEREMQILLLLICAIHTAGREVSCEASWTWRESRGKRCTRRLRAVHRRGAGATLCWTVTSTLSP